MIVETIRPSPHLSEFVERYWSMTGSETISNDHRVVPNGRSKIMIGFGDPFRARYNSETTRTFDAPSFGGQMNGPAIVRPIGRVGVFGIEFCPAGAYQLFRVPLYELTGQMDMLSLIWGNHDATLLWDAVRGNATTKQRVIAVESVLERRLAKAITPDRGIDAICRFIEANGGTVSLPTILHEFVISERSLERRFREHVGTGPKFFSRVVRFRRALHHAQRTGELGDAAYAAGYYDQSHFIRDVHAFAGTTPRHLIETMTPLAAYFHQRPDV